MMYLTASLATVQHKWTLHGSSFLSTSDAPSMTSSSTYGSRWNIDHEIPCDAMAEKTEQSLRTLCHFSNLLLMTIQANSSKCATILPMAADLFEEPQVPHL